MFGQVNLVQGLMYVIPLVLSLTVHEWAHAYAAFRLGDDTAARMGRLTLNPIPHIDPIGTLLLPMLGVPFGWAKPVPVVATRFRRDVSMRTGIMITSAAGPLSNLVLAVICTIAYGLLLRFGLLSFGSGIGKLLMIGIELNLALCVFNFLPIPPLDGSRIADGLMPYRFRPQWEMVTRYSWILLLLVVFAGRGIIAMPIAWLGEQLSRLLWLIAAY
jgi:Zn-dependent protease